VGQRLPPLSGAQSLRQIEALKADVGLYGEQLAAQVGSLEAEIGTHLWVTADFVEPASRALSQTGHNVAALRVRIERVHKGFSMLPREVDPVVEASAP